MASGRAPSLVAWTVLVAGVVSSGLVFVHQTSRSVASLAAGLAISALAFGLLWSLTGTRRRSLALAERMAESRRRSEERYRRVVDASTDGLYLFDADTKRIVDSNAALQRIVGYTAEELIDRPIYDIIAHEKASVDANLQRVLKTPPFVVGERQYRRKDGSTVAVEIGTNLLKEGERTLVVTVVHDISERRSLEERLRQSQKMEAIGRLAGGVAHDFNNVLTAILGYAELLETGSRDEEVRRNAEEIRKAADRAAALTRQLLAFSRRQVLQPKVFNLNSVIPEMDTMLRRILREDIRLVVSLDPELGPVRADPGQLQQVLLNLAVNARDAMPEGGELRIVTRNVVLSERSLAGIPRVEPGPYVRLDVSDTGLGMDPEVQAHAFEPFFTTKERGGGTGLGLSMVYGTVKQSGGYITVASEVGRGTSFQIHLPRVEGQPEMISGASPRPIPRGGSETILLVEDEGSVRNLARAALAKAGYTVLAASGAEEALTIARGHRGPIHLLLSDMVLPGLSGRRLAQELVTFRPETAILFMSGYPDGALAEGGSPETAAGFLQKPFTPETLGRRVRKTIDAAGRKTASPPS